MKTVNIEPAVCYANGIRKIATKLNVVSVKDNLFNYVQFKYTLLDENNQWAGEAAYELNGLAEYSTWFATPEGAFEIVAAGIGLKIVPTVGGASMFAEV